MPNYKQVIIVLKISLIGFVSCLLTRLLQKVKMGTKLWAAISLLICLGSNDASGKKPTLYEYFGGDGIKSGLVANSNKTFTLNGKELRIISGSLHYFQSFKGTE